MEPVSNTEATLILQKILGQRLRLARKAKGISLAELASTCGLHRSHICKMERGDANATLSTVLAITRVLGILLDDLFRDIPACNFSDDQRSTAQPSAQNDPCNSRSG